MNLVLSIGHVNEEKTPRQTLLKDLLFYYDCRFCFFFHRFYIPVLNE